MINKAIIFACKKHKDQLRKGTHLPYIVHPLEAMVITARMTDNPEVLCAAMLHDVMEDCGVLYEELEDIFGKRIADIVASVSDDKDIPWKERKQNKIDLLKCADRDIKIVALCDKLSNLRAIKKDFDCVGDKVWDKFSGKNKDDIQWYYTELLQALSTLRNTPEFIEAVNITDYLFK